MNHLQNNLEVSLDDHKNDKADFINKQNTKESYNVTTKNSENRQNGTSNKVNTNIKTGKEDEDLIEQDLSDVEDNYEEPSVQRYMPGIYVDLKLKTKTLEKNGNKIAIPMIVDFYSECVKKYGEEKNFIYEESYLENMKVKYEDLYPELYKFPKIPLDMTGEFQPQISLDNKQIINFPESQKTGPIEESLDDVIWLKNRPNDPLLRCIRSITDRLNIQGIVGDPTSYLKKGGDDMHYDMDDPFFDDSAMLSELKMSKSDILLQRAMEREFSDWSEDEEDLDYTNVESEDFISEYYGDFEKELKKKDKTQGEYKMFFDPAGWREYYSKIPKQFLPIYNEFENTSKKISEPITDKLLRLKIKELLESIFKKLNKIQELNRAGSKRRNKKTKPVEGMGYGNGSKEEPQEESEQKVNEKDNVVKEESENQATKNRNTVDQNYTENFKRRGLNCILPFRIIDINGKILRWIVKSICAMTNSCSPYEIHCEWFSLVVLNNERLVNEHSNKLKAKLTTKLQSMKPKKLELMISLVSESSKSLSKSLGIIKKLLKEHRDLNTHKQQKAGQKDGSCVSQKKSLIEISLDSTREDHDEFMGLDLVSLNREGKDYQPPKSDYTATPHTPAFLSIHSQPERQYHSVESVNEIEEKLKETNIEEDKVASNRNDVDRKSETGCNNERNDYPEISETNTSSSAVECDGSTTQDNTVEFCIANEKNGYINGKNEDLGSEYNSEAAVRKESAQDDKSGVMAPVDQGTKTPKKVPTTKDEDLETILKQSKIMNRVKDVHRLFRIVGSEIISLVQISNLAISVANKLQTKEFKHVVEHQGLTQNPFDQTYKRLAELISKTLQELYEVKINLVTDVVKVVVIKLQNQLKVEDLYEKKNKKPLLLFDNSHTKASPGVVILEQPKQRSNKKTLQAENPEGSTAGAVENTGKPKETKGSPRRRNMIPYTKANESGAQELVEGAKKRRRTPTPSRVNSLKELLLSRLRN